jgi:hypothetical protein
MLGAPMKELVLSSGDDDTETENEGETKDDGVRFHRFV